jgi:hypothetical protein
MSRSPCGRLATNAPWSSADVGGVDVLGVEGRILAHEHAVELAEPHYLRLAELEPFLRVGEHPQIPAVPVGHTITQEEVRLLEIGELPATSGSRKQHGKCGVLRKFDLRDRVHHDGKTSSFRHRQLRPQKRDVTGIAGGIPIC